MKTVKEIAKLTGVSVRTLHYYDEIGLLVPTSKSETGYRLYDDKAVERLEHILFFREFDISLKEIKSIIDDPDLDRDRILRMQKNMLVAKKERLERLIAGIDDVLKGEAEMDFSIFDKTELEEMFLIMTERMPENMKELAVKEFGDAQEWKEHYMKTLSSKEMQEQYAEVVKMYGSKENYLSHIRENIPKKDVDAFKAWEEELILKLVELRNESGKHAAEISKLIAEYGAGCRKFYGVEDEKMMMLSYAKSLRNEMVNQKIDERFGEGVSDFLAEAIETIYQ